MDNEFNKFGEWEDAWQQAFKDAEQAPAGRVWQGLENSLMEQQLRHYRRKLFLYQWLAAASVVLLGLWSGWWLFLGQPRQNDYLAAEQEIAQNQTQAQQQTTGSEMGQSTGKAAFQTAPDQSVASVDEVTTSDNSRPDGLAKSASPQAVFSNESSDRALAGLDRNGNSAATGNKRNANGAAEKSSLISSQTKAVDEALVAGAETNQNVLLATETNDALATHGYPELSGLQAQLSLQQGEVNPEIRVVANYTGTVAIRDSRSNSIFGNGKVWVGASLASNVFDPNVANARSHELAWAEEPPAGKGGQVYTANVGNWDEKEHSVPSIDFKLDAAFRLSNRWMLQSSVQYGSYRVNTISGTFTDVESQLSYPLYYTNFSYDKLQVASSNSRIAAPVEAQNTYKFLSIPLSFSYILVERQVGLALSTGLSSDFFLGGYIDGTNKNNFWNLERYDISSGESSPFRKVHFNALLGAQLFYRAGHNYIITLEPTYKYAITDFNKSSSYFGSRPTQFGVAAGFRFILK